MNLNFRLQTDHTAAAMPPVLLIHGLFGSLDNLGALARGLHQHPTIQADVRNHGLSPRADDMSYPAMAQDMLETLDDCGIDKISIIGHSMGGKIAMAMTALAPERIEKLVVLDIAPVNYPTRRHDAIFAAINAVTAAGLTSRQQAATIMRQHLTEEDIIQFLLKSFHVGQWRFNVPALWTNYTTISGWETVPAWPHPILFIRGEHSSYLHERYRTVLLDQFPQAKGHIIAQAGHWVHAEKPDEVLRTIRRFFAQK